MSGKKYASALRPNWHSAARLRARFRAKGLARLRARYCAIDVRLNRIRKSNEWGAATIRRGVGRT